MKLATRQVAGFSFSGATGAGHALKSRVKRHAPYYGLGNSHAVEQSLGYSKGFGIALNFWLDKGKIALTCHGVTVVKQSVTGARFGEPLSFLAEMSEVICLLVRPVRVC